MCQEHLIMTADIHQTSNHVIFYILKNVSYFLISRKLTAWFSTTLAIDQSKLVIYSPEPQEGSGHNSADCLRGLPATI